MPADRPALAIPKAQARTRQGNNKGLLTGVDGRSWAARRYREIAADLAGHIGDMTIPQEAIVRRAAQLQTWCEAREVAFARGEDFDVASYTTAVNSLRRLLQDLGLERRLRDVTSLAEYISGLAETDG